MSKKIIYSLVIIAISSIGLGLGAVFFSGELVFSDSAYDYDVDITEVRDIDGISKITIDNISANIVIIPENRDNIKVHYYGNVSSTKDIPQLSIITDGEEIIIKLVEPKKMIRILYFVNIVLEIYIPEDYIGDLTIDSKSGNIEFQKSILLDRLSLNSFSGNLDINHLSTKDTDIHFASGNLKVGNLQAEDIDIKSFSGNIRVDNLRANDCNLKMSSGNLRAEVFHSKRADINIFSGDLSIDDFQGKLLAETKSGNIKLNISALDYDVNLRSLSGNTIIDLPDEASFYLEVNTIGNIYNYFPADIEGVIRDGKIKGIVNNDKVKVILRNTSGNITIK